VLPMLKILHLLIEMLSCQLVAQSLIRLSTVFNVAVMGSVYFH